MESKMFKNVHILTFFEQKSIQIYKNLYKSIFWAIMVRRKHLLLVINFGICVLGKETTNRKFCLKILRLIYEILRILTNSGIVWIL